MPASRSCAPAPERRRAARRHDRRGPRRRCAAGSGAAVPAEGLADGLHDAAPVGVTAEEGRLDQRRVGRRRGRRAPPAVASAPVTVRRTVCVAPSPSATMEMARASSAAVSASPEPGQARRRRASRRRRRCTGRAPCRWWIPGRRR